MNERSYIREWFEQRQTAPELIDEVLAAFDQYAEQRGGTENERNCALAYAMWDSVNSVRMERPDDVEYHVSRAREVRRFLQQAGFDVVRTR